MPSGRTVAHYIHNHLLPTEGWISDQISFLKRTRSFVLAKRLSAPPVSAEVPVYALSSLGRMQRAASECMHATTGTYRFFEEACLREGPDVMHAHFGNRALEVLPLARRLRLPLITSFYGRDMSRQPGGQPPLARCYEELFSTGVQFLAEGPAARRRLINLGCPEAKIAIHRLAIDLQRHAFSLRTRALKEPFRVLMAARFIEKKGFEFGVEAFARAARGDRRLSLTIVGEAIHHPEWAIKTRLQEIIRRHDVGDQVRFAGAVSRDELDTLARAHHILLHPSVTAADGDSEGGHPVVMTELAATGMPIIASRHDDIPQVVLDDQSGWLCEERNIGQLIDAIRDASDSPDKLAHFSARARQVAEEKYDGTKNTLDDIYQRVADAACGPQCVPIMPINEGGPIDGSPRPVNAGTETS